MRFHALNKESKNGEVSEWLKEHAWKVCIRQRIEGSNPSLTAILKEELQQCGFFCMRNFLQEGGGASVLIQEKQTSRINPSMGHCSLRHPCLRAKSGAGYSIPSSSDLALVGSSRAQRDNIA